ncbi:MAG: hypothetical protein KJ963_00765 [Bacteroidetes bacterium]|nr:hypothetical protein [Bacteroidota bacterium]MBU1423535.1 hypothetical protein [Bacteroidota bacterium]MBU2635610.1 hypothetical protein [Bacteroidota bacterium]
MLTNPKIFEEFEKNLLKSEQVDYFKNLSIFEEMLKEVIYLNILPLKNPLDGIETDIKIARILNNV